MRRGPRRRNKNYAVRLLHPRHPLGLTRIKDEGIVAFVSNGGCIDGEHRRRAAQVARQEFARIYCYNLRGNQRTAGEQSRKEGGKIFGSGSRNTVAILILVKEREGPGQRGLIRCTTVTSATT